MEQGAVKMDAPLGLLKDFREQGYALMCCAYPRSDIVCELQVWMLASYKRGPNGS